MAFPTPYDRVADSFSEDKDELSTLELFKRKKEPASTPIPTAAPTPVPETPKPPQFSAKDRKRRKELGLPIDRPATLEEMQNAAASMRAQQPPPSPEKLQADGGFSPSDIVGFLKDISGVGSSRYSIGKGFKKATLALDPFGEILGPRILGGVPVIGPVRKLAARAFPEAAKREFPLGLNPLSFGQINPEAEAAVGRFLTGRGDMSGPELAGFLREAFQQRPGAEQLVLGALGDPANLIVPGVGTAVRAAGRAAIRPAARALGRGVQRATQLPTPSPALTSGRGRPTVYIPGLGNVYDTQTGRPLTAVDRYGIVGPLPTGKAGLLQELDREMELWRVHNRSLQEGGAGLDYFGIGGATEGTIGINPRYGQVGREFIESLPDELVDDVYLRVESPTPREVAERAEASYIAEGVMAPRSNPFIVLLKSAYLSKHTADNAIIHEVAHHLEQFVPEAEIVQLVAKYREEWASSGKKLFDDTITAQYSRDLTDAEVDRIYRWRDYNTPRGFGEWFAEVMADKGYRDVLIARDAAIRTPIQHVLDIIKSLATPMRNLVRRISGNEDLAESVYQRLRKGEFDPAARRRYSDDRSWRIPGDPEDTAYTMGSLDVQLPRPSDVLDRKRPAKGEGEDLLGAFRSAISEANARPPAKRGIAARELAKESARLLRNDEPTYIGSLEVSFRGDAGRMEGADFIAGDGVLRATRPDGLEWDVYILPDETGSLHLSIFSNAMKLEREARTALFDLTTDVPLVPLTRREVRGIVDVIGALYPSSKRIQGFRITPGHREIEQVVPTERGRELGEVTTPRAPPEEILPEDYGWEGYAPTYPPPSPETIAAQERIRWQRIAAHWRGLGIGGGDLPLGGHEGWRRPQQRRGFYGGALPEDRFRQAFGPTEQPPVTPPVPGTAAPTGPTPGRSRFARFIGAVTPGSPAPVTPGPAPETPILKLTNALRTGRVLSKGIREKQATELSKRARDLAREQQTGDAYQAFLRSKRVLKGPLPAVGIFPRPGEALTGRDVSILFDQIRKTDYLRPFEIENAQQAMQDLLTQGVIPTRGDLAYLERVFGEDFTKVVLSRRQFSKKAWDAAGEVWNIPRAVLSSWDLSAPLRQGAVLAPRHPKEWKGAMDPMRKAWQSEKYALDLDYTIRTGKHNALRQQSGLYHAPITGVGTKLSGREEAFISSWARVIPGVRRSERAYISFLNKLRSDVFNSVVDSWQRNLDLAIANGEDTTKLIMRQSDYDALARFINQATGRGGLGKEWIEDASVFLSGVLFSPRLQASRIALATSLLTGTAKSKVAAAEALVSFTLTGVTIMGLAKLGGADIGMNPLSSDFGKIKIGKTRLDLWAGFAPYARFIAQMAKSQRKVELTGRTKAENRARLARRFLRSKLMPSAGFVWDLLEGTDYMGQPVEATPQEAFKRLAPLFIQDLMSAIDKEGLTGAAVVSPAFFGVGAVTHKLPDWPELNEYFEKETPSAKLLYRRTHPEQDAKLFIIGQVTTLKSPRAPGYVVRIMQENDISPEDIRKVGDVSPYQKLFGSMTLPEKPGPTTRGSGEVPTTIRPRKAPRSQTVGPEMPPSERWEQATLWLDARLLKALDKVWNQGGKLTDNEYRLLKRIWERIPFGERNFNTWVMRTLRQAQASTQSEVQSQRR